MINMFVQFLNKTKIKNSQKILNLKVNQTLINLIHCLMNL
nr:MAG TPA: hypothetical protein [Herelleviridae sp.]